MADRRVVGPVTILTAVALGLGAWLLLNSGAFAVREIRVSGNDVLPTSEVLDEAGVEVGDNLFRLSPDAVEAALLRNAWIAGARVHRRWPSTLVLELTERRAVGWVEDGDGTVVLVAGDGTVLEDAAGRPGRLPSLGTVAPNLVPAAGWQGPPVAVRVAASFPPSLRRLVAGIRVGEGGVRLRLRPGGSALYGQATALEAKNAALLSILRRDDLVIDYVDLRIASAPAVKPASPG